MAMWHIASRTVTLLSVGLSQDNGRVMTCSSCIPIIMAHGTGTTSCRQVFKAEIWNAAQIEQQDGNRLKAEATQLACVCVLFNDVVHW
jgi:hypothetical protein